jgi:two-component system sensor histidine kinase UhpB
MAVCHSSCHAVRFDGAWNAAGKLLITAHDVLLRYMMFTQDETNPAQRLRVRPRIDDTECVEDFMKAEPSPSSLRSERDLWLVVVLAVGTYAIAVRYELTELFFGTLARYERWQVDELPLTATVFAIGLMWYAFRRRREARVELLRRIEAEARSAELLTHNQELSRRLISVQESERLSLARELHDEIGQGCSAIRAETAFMRNCAQTSHADALKAAARADEAAQSLYGLVRGMLRRLRPANLDTLGLVSAMQELCESWEERSGVACAFDARDAPRGLGDAVDIALYRITQEALTNVLRHAAAREVIVVIDRIDDGIGPPGVRLVIQDDGRGMDVSASTHGLGLLGSSERAAGLGGTLELQSSPGQGVTITVRIPTPASAVPGAAIAVEPA